MPRRAARWAALGLALALSLALPAAATAQQRVYAVTPHIVFLPQDGVALDAATGRVAWRVGRFDGPVLTDGHGLVIYAYLAGVNEILHFHQFRFCRVAGATGARAWCFDTAHLQDAALSARGDFLYVRRGGALDVYDTANGRRLRSYGLKGLEGADLFALPQDGVAVFVSTPRRSRLLTIFPNGRQLSATLRVFDRALHAFHGPGAGVLWYAPQAGEFVAIADGRTAYPGLAVQQAFPRALTDDQGFLIAQRQPSGWTLAGGLYRGSVWTLPLEREPSLFLAGGVGAILTPATDPAADIATRVAVVPLATGHLAFARDFHGQFGLALLDAGLAGAGKPLPALVVFGPEQIVLMDRRSGNALWWRDYGGYEPAVLTAPTVVVWDHGELVGLARSNGDIVWRVRFRLVNAGKR